MPDWHPEFLNACVSQEALFSLLSRCLLSACSPPCLSGCLFAKAFLYTLPDLTNAGAKTTTDYMKKATAVTADSMMVYSSTLNPMFWGLILCAWVCYCVLCGLTCLVFVSRVFSCFENTLWRHISHFMQYANMQFLKPWLKISGPEAGQYLPLNSPSFPPLTTCSPDTCRLYRCRVAWGTENQTLVSL